MSKKKVVLRNLSSIGLMQFSNYVMPLISVPIISRIIGPSHLGSINFINSIVAYFVLLIGYGFDLSATRRVAAKPHDEENRNIVFSEVFSCQLVLFLVSCIIFTLLFFFMPQVKQEKEVALFTFLICGSTLLTQNWLFQAMQDLHKVALLNFLSKIFFTVSVIYLVKEKSDYIWQPLCLSLSQLIISIGSFVWAYKKYKIHFKLYGISKCFNVLWDEKIIFISLCIINIFTNTNILILGLFQNSTQVGYYTAAHKLIILLQSIITIPLQFVFFPFIGKAFKDDYDNGILIVKKLVAIVFVVTFIASMFIEILAPFLIQIIYGKDFGDSVIVLRIFAFIPMIISLSSLLGIQVMLNLKMENYFLKIISIGACIGLLINLTLINKIGYLGVAISWVSTETLILFMAVYVLRSKKINVIDISYLKPRYFYTMVKQLLVSKTNK